MRPERLQKFSKVVSRRQADLSVILENVTDMHNIGAVLRSCDSVGINEIFILNTEPHLATDQIIIGKKTSSGARKWVDVHYYTDPTSCFRHVRQKCRLVLSTSLGENSSDLYNLDLTQSIAFLFGNEHAGLSAEVAKFADGNFTIPQVGMVESLNVSVACAVTLYETFRQRKLKGFYDENPTLDEPAENALLEDYVKRHDLKLRNKKFVKKKD